MAHMQNKVVDLISKPPHQRREHLIQIVLPWLRKKSGMFQDMDRAILTDVIRNCDYQKASRDGIIIEQGESGNNFYIMLTGTTSVYIDTTKAANEEGDNSTNPDTTASTTQDSSDKDMESDNDFDEDDDLLKEEEKILDRNKYGKFIMHYEAGKSFGEVALMSDDSVRNATIIADEDTDLLVISRELFNRSVKAKQEEEYEERKTFIATNPYFRNWSLKFRRLLEMSIRKEFYPSGSVILQQGEPLLGLLFILSGQAKVTVRPDLHNRQFPLLMKQDISSVAKELGRDNYNRLVKKDDHTVRQQQVHIRRMQGYAAAEKRIMGRNVDLCCIETNDIIGDLEMALELEKSLFTVTCTENTTIMLLDTKNYDRLISKRNQTTINKLCQTSLQKLKSRLQNDVASKVPLLKILHNKLQDKVSVKYIKEERIEEKAKSDVLEILIDMFLRGKVPLIEPFVPDALVYKRKSERRARMIEIQNKKNKDVADKVEDRLYSNRRRQRVARSLKQLRNVRTENELLKPLDPFVDLSVQRASTSIRPRTSIGFQRETHSHSTIGSSNGRPQTAGIFHLTESNKDDDQTAIPSVAPEEIEMGVEEIIEQLDYVQRGKSENRSRVLCSAFAVSDLKQNMKVGGMSASSIEGDPFDEECFDWETSEKNLCSLEDRIKHFCTVDTGSATQRPSSVSALRRYAIKEDRDEETLELHVPKPGGTVFVRKRECPLKKTSPKEAEAGHSHVRRFIVTRDEQAEFTSLVKRRPKSASPALMRNNSRASLTSINHLRPKTAANRQISILG